MVFRLLLVVVVVAGAGCARKTAPVPPECAARPVTPAWDPTTDDGLRTILGYAGNLGFAPAGHPTGERRPLTVIVQRGAQPRGNGYQLANQPGEGTTAWGIAPEQCTHLFDLSDLGPGGATSGVGEIVGYIEAPRPYLKPPADGQGPLPNCNETPERCRVAIPQGNRVFLWVDSLGETSARGLLIPDGATSPTQLVRVTVRYIANPPGLGVRSFPEARWLFDAADDDAWVSCVKTGCCVVELG